MDTLPAVVTATLVLYVVPVTYCTYPHGLQYLLHRLLARLSWRGSGLCCQDGHTTRHSAFRSTTLCPMLPVVSFLYCSQQPLLLEGPRILSPSL